MMGTATAGIAFLPVYSDIGVAAIVLLSILRFAQGLALGGSWDGLPSLLALNAPQNRRGWYAMIPQLGAPLGFMLARSEEHTSELQSLMRISYAVFCLKKKQRKRTQA